MRSKLEPKPTTLAAHLDKFTDREMGLIMWALNKTDSLGYEVHKGILPFVSIAKIMVALEFYGNATLAGKRIKATIQGKLRDIYKITEAKSWLMSLNSAKVVRRFGSHPERGHNIPLSGTNKKKVTVGVRWSLPKRDYEPDDDVLVTPHVVIKPVHGKRDMFEVTCDPKHYEHVTNWLLQYCT